VVCKPLAYDFLDLLQEVVATVFAEFLGVLFSLLDICVLEHSNSLEVLIENTPVEFYARFSGGLSGSFWFGFDSSFRGRRIGFRGLLRFL
jgi:hypothetical protein